MPGAPLSLPEREEIAHALTLNPAVSWAHIARRVGRQPTTIARDVVANGGRSRYRPAVAERAATMLDMLVNQVVHNDLVRPLPAVLSQARANAVNACNFNRSVWDVIAQGIVKLRCLPAGRWPIV